jgi:hypothetical protein
LQTDLHCRPGAQIQTFFRYRDSSRQIALIKGRVKTRSTGEAATKLNKHGGLSLMEMLTPWIEIEVGS